MNTSSFIIIYGLLLLGWGSEDFNSGDIPGFILEVLVILIWLESSRTRIMWVICCLLLGLAVML